MGESLHVRQQIVMRRLTIARLLQHRRRSGRLLRSPHALASNDSYVRGRSLRPTHWQTGVLSTASAAHPRCVAARGMLFILRCGGPAKRRRNSLLIHLRHAAPPADGRYHARFMRLHVNVKAQARRTRQAPSADESPSPQHHVDAAPPPVPNARHCRHD